MKSFLKATAVAVCILLGGHAGLGKSGKKKSDGIDVPIEPGHAAEGVRLPYFNSDGKLQMALSIEHALRKDEDHIEMTAVLDLKTRVVTSAEPVTIRRADFEITGETMIFNTATRVGKMKGKVRMLIFEPEKKTDEKTDAKAE